MMKLIAGFNIRNWGFGIAIELDEKEAVIMFLCLAVAVEWGFRK